MEILITNDDGIEARGLEELRRALEGLGRITVVAPDRERSGAGHALTLHRPLTAEERGEDRYAVDGTPTDCVLLAVHGLMPRSPEVLVSGINHGPNMGDDITYSGTVAAAFEGTLLGIPSVAISVADRGAVHFEGAAMFARRITAEIRRRGLPEGTLLNVNVPDIPLEEIQGVRWARLGKRIYLNAVSRVPGVGARSAFQIGGEASWRSEEGTDFDALESRMIAVTPIHLDLTDYNSLEELRRWDISLKD